MGVEGENVGGGSIVIRVGKKRLKGGVKGNGVKGEVGEG